VVLLKDKVTQCFKSNASRYTVCDFIFSVGSNCTVSLFSYLTELGKQSKLQWTLQFHIRLQKNTVATMLICITYGH